METKRSFACLLAYVSSAMLMASSSAGAIQFVSATGSNQSPYTNWATAAHRIQDAVNVAVSGGVVMVAAGTYNQGGSTFGGYGLTNRVVLTNSVSVVGVDGPEVTIIEGSGDAVDQVVRCVFMNTGSTLAGFTLRGGRTKQAGVFPFEQNGGGAYLYQGGSISNCVIEDCEGSEGGGAYLHMGGRISFSTIRQNHARANGGGVRFSDAVGGVLEQCRILGNRADVDGGGVQIYHSGRVRSCLIANNMASFKGGAVFVDGGGNSAAAIENCTIVHNEAPNYGGLNYTLSGAAVRNSILWANSNGNWNGGSYANCLTTPQPAGSGNINVAPIFADSQFRLSNGSPGLNAGSNSYVTTGVDLDGLARIMGGIVDLGAYESTSGVVTVSAPLVPTGPATLSVGLPGVYNSGGSTSTDGAWVEYRFDAGDGRISPWSNQTEIALAWGAEGLYLLRAQARSASNTWAVSDWSGAFAVSVSHVPVTARTHYVSTTGGNIAPYTNWAMAAHRIQDAVNVAVSGGVVMVAAGTYNQGGSTYGGYGLTNRVVLTNSVTVVGVDGPEVTIIEGSVDAVDQVVRCVFMNTGSTLAGFTLRGGRTKPAGVFPFEQNGGGAYLYQGGSISNCVIEACEGSEGGGAYLHMGGRISFSTIRQNHARTGGGGVRFSDAASGVLECSRIINNTSAGEGGGLHIYHMGHVRSCLVAGNSAMLRAGAIFVDWGSYGSGAFVDNCTIVNNTAPQHGGLHYVIAGAQVRNSIISGNANGNWSGGSYTHCVSQPLPDGAGNLDGWPVYADADYRLASGSPGLNAGINSEVTSATDLDGLPRIADGVVDIGAYENAGGLGLVVSTPHLPSGKVEVTAGEVRSYETGGSISSDGAPVQYRFNWGDGPDSEWSFNAYASTAWPRSGIYAVRAQARSSSNLWNVSAWSPALMVTVSNPAVVARTRYVSPHGGDLPPYTNWSQAARRIQDAINVCADGDAVWVSNGVYRERINFGGREIQVMSLFPNSGDTGDIARTVIDGEGSGRVVTFDSGETRRALLRGFTVTNGYAIAGSGYPGHGGGIVCFSSSPRLLDLVLDGNHAVHEGGGIYLGHSESELLRVTARNNTAGQNSGGIRVSYGNPSLQNVQILDNQANDGAGGMLLYHSSPLMRNMLIARNHTPGVGGGLFFDASSPIMENITVVENAAATGGGGGLNVSYMSHPKLKNSIVWGNVPEQIVFEQTWFGMALTVMYSDLQDGLAGVVTRGKGPVHWLDGNIALPPEFRATNDYRLTMMSPVRDAGVQDGWMIQETDLDGRPRVAGSSVDMGAYEYHALSGSDFGQLTCIIKPDEVALVNARWRMTSGLITQWMESGQSVQVSTGLYDLAFTPVPGWIAPAVTQVWVHAWPETVVECTYTPTSTDHEAPVLVDVSPKSGHVSNGNQIPMTIRATDNTGVAYVLVNGNVADASGAEVFHYTADNVRGSYNRFEIVVFDIYGNSSTGEVYYGQGGRMRLHAIWDGYWRVRNPYTNDLPFTWDVEGDPSEFGAGVALANADTYFTNAPGRKVVRLYVYGTLVDVCRSSRLKPQDPTVNVVMMDSDLDGFSNLEEEIAGTDQNDEQSVFRLVAPSESAPEPPSGPSRLSNSSGGNSMVFRWMSSPDSTYTIESSTNLFNWVAAPQFATVPGTGEEMAFTNASFSPISLYLRLRADKR